MIRIAAFSGLSGSGKTSLIIRLMKTINGKEAIFNNAASMDMAMNDIPDMNAVAFPLTAPCGRARQFSGTLEKFITSHGIENEVIMVEPAGPCIETMSPLLCPLVAFKGDSIEVSPLINVINGCEIVKKGIDPKTAEGLRMRQHINEADVVAVSFSDMLKPHDRNLIKDMIEQTNPDCEIIFISNVTGEGTDPITDTILSEREMSRALTM